MKPIITKTQHAIIKGLIAHLPDRLKTKEIGELNNELKNANVVNDDKIASDVIQINSYFEIEDLTTKQQIKLTLTLPGQANVAEKRISILSPLGVALIGFREGKTVEWTLPGGRKRLKILKVEQPIDSVI